eukprot:6188334-Pleurochrysis_carterae.AAC.1
MAPGLPAASASAVVTRPLPSIAVSTARRKSAVGIGSMPAGRRAPKATTSVRRRCAGGGIRRPSSSRVR